MKKLLIAILAVAMLLSVCLVPAAALDNHMDFSKLQPVVGVKVNGNWYIADLTPYLGEENTWVEIPIDPTKLNSAIENYFSLRTNVNASGDFSDTSADVYATAVENASASFLCNDPWCDNGFTMYTDRTLNIKIQIDKGNGWETLSEDASYKQDHHTVLGQFQGGDWFNAARNIVLPEFSGVVRARVLVNMHVGKDVVPMTSFASLATYDLTNMGWIFSNAPAVRARINGHWYGTDLTSYAGQDNAWVHIPIDLSVLKANETNYLNLSSNVLNNGNMDDSSADILFTNSTVGNSFLTNNQWCDDGWQQLTDRIVNARIELYDGRDWIAIPNGETYGKDSTTVLGQFQGGTWYNFARNLDIGAIDLSQYKGARVSVNMHVGKNIQCAPYCIWDFANFREPVKETPKFSVSATAGKGGSISGAPADKVCQGDQVTLTATADGGYIFLGWFKGDTKVSDAASYTFTVTQNVKLEARFGEAGHKYEPEQPGAATSTADSDKAAVKVRVNGFWYGAYLEDFKGKNDAWVPVYIPIEKLNGGAENYFNVSSNVINHGNFTDSSVDLYATTAAEGQQSFLTNHQWCDDGWTMYNDRNINIKLQVFNGTKWITLTPETNAYYDEHTVLGLFSDNGTWYNAARNMMVGDLSGYKYARVLVHMNVGSKLDVAADFAEENFAEFIANPVPNPSTGDNTPLELLICLMCAAAAGFVVTLSSKKRI